MFQTVACPGGVCRTMCGFWGPDHPLESGASTLRIGRVCPRYRWAPECVGHTAHGDFWTGTTLNNANACQCGVLPERYSVCAPPSPPAVGTASFAIDSIRLNSVSTDLLTSNFVVSEPTQDYDIRRLSRHGISITGVELAGTGTSDLVAPRAWFGERQAFGPVHGVRRGGAR